MKLFDIWRGQSVCDRECERAAIIESGEEAWFTKKNLKLMDEPNIS